MTKRLLILSFCFCLFILPAFASDISLDDPSFSNPNEREDNVSYVNSVSFGRGWGSGEEARPSSHAHSDTDSLLPYNALEQTISSQAQPALVFGGEELPLSLEDGSLFTAGLGLWDGNGYEAGGMINALCLTSQNPDARWIIPGSVLRKLSGSGISHLVLHTGQTQAVLPTASVLDGTQYDLWRRAGRTDGTFLYFLSLPEGSLEVEVDGALFPVIAHDATLSSAGFQISPLRGEP